MTKTQAQKKIRELLETLSSAREEAEDLRDESEETYESIEPYEGMNELTPAQEERQEWFDCLTSALNDLCDNIEEAQNYLEEME